MAEWTAFETELGWIALGWSDRGLSRLHLAGRERPEICEGEPPEWVREGVAALRDHLAGKHVELSTIPLDLDGLAPFTRRVLEALRTTAPGETFTYGQLARMVGSPGAARAVGQVMARNPLPILIPCHRVVAANGPGGFSLFGSLETKTRLMTLESVRE